MADNNIKRFLCRLRPLAQVLRANLEAPRSSSGRGSPGGGTAERGHGGVPRVHRARRLRPRGQPPPAGAPPGPPVLRAAPHPARHGDLRHHGGAGHMLRGRRADRAARGALHPDWLQLRVPRGGRHGLRPRRAGPD
eukprot:4629711-Pyramimonas_sp.AAC.1